MLRISGFFATLAIASLLSAPSLAEGDIAKGKKVFNKCKACHVADTEKNKIGPHLVGMFGRKAGSLEKFKYSNAMKNSGVVWTAETLDEYLKKPRTFIKGTRMAFAGIRKDEERADLIAYLKSVTQPKK